MDDQRIGRVVRALRRNRGWRQVDVARKARCSQATISLIERGHLGHVSVPLLRAVLAEIQATLVMDVRWRGAGLERLLDEEHAALGARVVALLSRHGCQARLEVTYSEYGERGSYDILAWHSATRTLLVIEVKTDLPSAEATARKLDEKTRLARKIALDQFGWRPVGGGKASDNAGHFDTAAACRPTRDLLRDGAASARRRRPQLAPPTGRPNRRLWFVSVSDDSSAIHSRGGRERVRVPNSPSASDDIAA